MEPAQKQPLDTKPTPIVYLENIGGTKWELHETELDVFNEVTLWNDNPRLLPHLPAGAFPDENALEAALTRTPGYDGLKKSISHLGQMEPVYVWRKDEDSPYIVFEGSTRVTCLRDLARKHAGGKLDGKFNRVKAKILPPHFGEKERVILLARIHVRGSGVRAWGRYIEAKFIHEYVTEQNGKPALMSVTDMADYMEKSVSWVQRLRDAYQFALKFIEYVDDEAEGEKMAAERFSTLEEISKATKIGSMLRDFDNENYDSLRAEVFDMVRNEVFKEYRDARFMKQFHEDPEKWSLLKTGEKHIAAKLANEIKAGNSSLKAKISGLEQSIERGLREDEHGLDDQDIQLLRNAATRIQQRVHVGVEPFRLELKNAAKVLSQATLHDVKNLQQSDLAEFRQALEYFDMLIEKYGESA